MKLELKHLAGYLPYDIKYQIVHEGIMINEIATGIDTRMEYPNQYIIFGNIEGWKFIGDKKVLLSSCKPILRPLSDLTKDIEVNGKKFVPIIELLKLEFPDQEKTGRYAEITISENGFPNACYTYQANRYFTVYTNYINTQPYWVVQKLLEWHFDIYGLIEYGLAIDINTLNK